LKRCPRLRQKGGTGGKSLTPTKKKKKRRGKNCVHQTGAKEKGKEQRGRAGREKKEKKHPTAADPSKLEEGEEKGGKGGDLEKSPHKKKKATQERKSRKGAVCVFCWRGEEREGEKKRRRR